LIVAIQNVLRPFLADPRRIYWRSFIGSDLVPCRNRVCVSSFAALSCVSFGIARVFLLTAVAPGVSVVTALSLRPITIVPGGFPTIRTPQCLVIVVIPPG